MNNQIFTLSECNRENHGNKAHVLGLLTSHFNVPRGFSLSGDFYDTYLKNINSPFSYKDYYGQNLEIQDYIRNSNFNETQENDIVYSIKQCDFDKDSLFVVRSSASCEDQQKTSMAGIFESFIGLKNTDDILRAIKECYCSLFSERALAYYDMFDIDITNLKMSVIIQQYVVGVFSGVIFTADTKTNDMNSVYINYVQGKCADFVDSNKQSFFIKMDKHTSAIIDTNKPDSTANNPTDAVINELYHNALEIEKKLGYPADIEWTYDGEKIYILQARPITTLKNERIIYEVTEDDKKYNWFLVGQNPVKPMFEDFFRSSYAHRGEGIRRTGYGSQNGVLKQVQGYMYIGFGYLDNEKSLRDEAIQRFNELTKDNISIFHDILLPKILSMKKQMDEFLNRDLNNKEVADYLTLALNYSNFIDEAHWDSVLGEEYIEVFHKYINEFSPDTTTEQLYNLIYRETMKTKEREMLLRFSAFFKAHPDIADMISSPVYVKIIYERLKLIMCWNEIEKLIDKYIDVYGMQIVGNKNLPAYPLCEKPEYIIEKMRGTIGQDFDLYQTNIKDINNKKQIEKAKILKLLPDNKKDEFLNKLHLAEKTFASIDDHHYYCEDMAWGYVKTAISKASNKLVKINKINHVDDIYFLEFNEIIDLLRDASIVNIDIENRKWEYNRKEKMLPPQPLFVVEESKSIDSSSKDIDTVDIQSAESTTILKGVSSMNKIVRGEILIAHGIPNQINDECILVVNNGHGGDLFNIVNKVKGLIVAGGSPFDHMGIITREMNIPAIYYVEKAFEALKNGDNVILNGVDGSISVIN